MKEGRSDGAKEIRDRGILKHIKPEKTVLQTFDFKLNLCFLIRVDLLHLFSSIHLSTLPPCWWKPRNSITGENYISLNELDRLAQQWQRSSREPAARLYSTAAFETSAPTCCYNSHDTLLLLLPSPWRSRIQIQLDSDYQIKKFVSKLLILKVSGFAAN